MIDTRVHWILFVKPLVRNNSSPRILPFNGNFCLDRYGVAIIDRVISPEDCEKAKEGFWSYLEHITSKFEIPVKRNDPTTFTEFWKLYPTHGMLLQHFGIGHAQMNWDIRQNPNVANVFSKIWNVPVEDLLTSFDGAR